MTDVVTIDQLLDQRVQQDRERESLSARLSEAIQSERSFTTGWEYTDNYAITSAAALNSAVNLTSFEEEYRKAQGLFNQSGVGTLTNTAVAAGVAEENQDLIAIAAENPDLQDEDGINGIAELIQTNNELADDPAALNQLLVKFYSPEQDIEAQREKAVIDYGYALLAKNFKDAGIGELTIDFLSSIVPGLDEFDVQKVESALGISLDEYANKFAALPPEAKAESLPGLIDAIQEVTGSVPITNEIVRAFLGSPDDIEFTRNLSRADLGLTLLAAGSTVFKGIGAINRLRRIGDDAVAAEAAAGLVLSNVDEAAVNLNKGDIHAQAVPFQKTEDYFSGASEDLVAEVGDALSRRRAEVQRNVQEFRIDQQGTLIGDERDTFLAAFEKHYFSEVDVEDVTLSLDGNAVVGSFIKRGDSELPGAVGGKTSFRYELTNKDIGSFDGELTAGPVRNRTLSPNSLFTSIKGDIAKRATFLRDFLLPANLSKFNKAAKAVYSGLNKDGIRKVDDVLLAGDQFRHADGVTQGKVFSLKELTLEGIQTNSGVVRLTANEASSYYAAREVWDQLFVIKNAGERRNLIFNGWTNNVRLTNNGLLEDIVDIPENAIVRQADNIPSDVETVWDATQGRRISRQEAEDLLTLNRGTAYRAHDSIRVRTDKGDEFLDYVIATDSDVGELPEFVLRYQQGYITRIRPDVHWVVRSSRPALVNGRRVESAGVRTERLFDRKDEAVAFREQQQALADAEGTGVRFEESLANDLRDTPRDELFTTANFGGLYTGARSQRQIKFGLNGGDPNRLSAAESLQRMSAHVARVGATNEFKLQAVEKFKNRWGDLLSDPDNFRSPLKTGIDPVERDNVERFRSWLELQIGLPTPATRAWEATTQGLALWAEKLPGSKAPFLNKLRNTVMRMSAQDPFAWGRAATFHALLGFYNPAQLLVQATGSSLAFSVHPERWALNNQRILGLRVGMQLLEAGNTGAIKGYAKNSWKVAGFDSAQEMEEAVTLLHRTGVWSSLRSNADYNAISLGASPDASTFRKLMGTATNKGLLFYREGEAYNRLYSVANAYEDWKVANKGKKLTQDDADLILKDSFKYSLNLYSANKAAWQEGVLSIPTQFMQIHTKFAESLLGKELSAAERVRMLSGQAVLFGAAGVPLVGNQLSRAAVETWFEDANELTEEQIAAMSGGVSGWLTNSLVGEGGLDINRFSISSGIQDVVETAISGEVDFLGAFGSIPEGAGRAFAYMSAVAPLDIEGIEDDKFLAISDEWLDIVKTWDNASKMYAWLRYSEIRDNAGNLKYSLDEDSTGAIIARGLGFTTWRESNLWRTGKYLFQRDKARKQSIDTMTNLILDFARDEKSPEQLQRIRDLSTFLNGMWSDVERIEIMESAIKRAILPKSKEEQQLREILKLQIRGSDLSDLPVGAEVRER